MINNQHSPLLPRQREKLSEKFCRYTGIFGLSSSIVIILYLLCTRKDYDYDHTHDDDLLGFDSIKDNLVKPLNDSYIYPYHQSEDQSTDLLADVSNNTMRKF